MKKAGFRTWSCPATMTTCSRKMPPQPRSRAGPFLPADATKIGIEQFQQVTHFGREREFERPRYSPKVRSQTPGLRRMGRDPGNPEGKRVCGDLKKDLRKRRKFAKPKQ